MANIELVSRVTRRLGHEVTAETAGLIGDLLDDAEAYILDRIGRNVMPERLRNVQAELAVIAFNKLGAEGESSRSEGGISRVFDDLPSKIEKQLQNYPRKVGVLYVPTDG